MKRKALLIIVLINTFLITSCADRSREEAYYDEMIGYEVQLEEAREKMSELQSEIRDLESSVSDLQSEIYRLNYEDWSDVVPDVAYQADSVQSELNYVLSSADDLEEVLQ